MTIKILCKPAQTVQAVTLRTDKRTAADLLRTLDDAKQAREWNEYKQRRGY